MKNSISIECTHCQTKNQLTKVKVLNLKETPLCKECNKQLLSFFDKNFDDISPNAFIHNLDRQMLNGLRKIPGIDSVLKFFLQHSFELSMRLHHQGNFVQASKKQAKKLHAKLEKAVEILDLGFVPELFIFQDPRPNAYTFGVEKCAIAISTGCVDLMNDQEQLCVLAHEVGHIKARHVLYKTASRILTSVADGIAQKTFGLGGLVLFPMQIALLKWDRASELSSDRAALLVVKNPSVVLSTLMKLAGGAGSIEKELNINAFIEQANNFEKTEGEGPLGKYFAFMSNIFNTHPFPIWRAKEILDWVFSPDFVSILQGNYDNTIFDADETCEKCGGKLNNQICHNCANNDAPKNAEAFGVEKTLGQLKNWYDKNFS